MDKDIPIRGHLGAWRCGWSLPGHGKGWAGKAENTGRYVSGWET